MIVKPSLTTHPKFVLFKAALGVPDALEYLIRLWSHCELDQRGENLGPVQSGYIEAICDWRGKPGALYIALVSQFCGKSAWITINKKNEVIVSNWNEVNAGLISSWANGRKGGRPRKNPPDNRPVNPPETGGVTDGKPTGKPCSVVKCREEKRGRGTRARAGKSAAGSASPETESTGPSLADILKFCADHEPKIPEETGRNFFHHYAKESSPPWVDGKGKRFQWPGKLESWAAEDKKTGDAPQLDLKNAEQLEAELSAERDPDRRKQLRDQLKKIAA